MVFFFFSSRRRHTRSLRDWSSDVCSSDLVGNVLARGDRTPDPAVLKRMNDRLAHRGPDDEGFFVEGPAALAMRRLKIIDLETGHQPMSGEQRRVWAVFNGEIYNYRELTAELTGRGHTFRTRSDTEVIVHG